MSTEGANAIWSLLALALAGSLLVACGATPPLQTATAAFQQAQTELESLIATATVERARIQTTLDYAEDRVAGAKAADEFLRHNLSNLGTDSAFIARELELIRLPAAGVAPGPGATQPAKADPQAPQPEKAPSVIVTPPVRGRAAERQETSARLEEVVMASGVDASDCAIDRNPRFTPASTAIYVVARAFEIPAGARISSTWRRAGVEVAAFSFQPEYRIHDSCIWFFIDQTDSPFLVDGWSVAIEVEGVALGPAVDFQIVAE